MTEATTLTPAPATTGSSFPIPRIIHQTYKTKQIPKAWRASEQDWKRYHPNWKYWLWTDEDNLLFLRQRYPGLIDLYTAFPYPIMRVDLIRYCILHTWGGIYSDLDQAPCRAVDDLFANSNCEAYFGSSSFAWVTNSLMASRPGAVIWPHVFAEIRRSFYDESISMMNRHFYIMNVTGPIMLTRVVNHYSSGIWGLLPTSFNPHDYDDPEEQSLPIDRTDMVHQLRRPPSSSAPEGEPPCTYTRPATVAGSERSIQWMRKLPGSGSWHHWDSKLLEFIVSQKKMFIVLALTCFFLGLLLILGVFLYWLYRFGQATYRSLTWKPHIDLPITYADHLAWITGSSTVLK